MHSTATDAECEAEELAVHDWIIMPFGRERVAVR